MSEGERISVRAVLVRLVRSAGAGLFATGADVGSLALLVQVFGVAPRNASAPALVFGSVVAFFGQKVAFESRGASRAEVARQMVLFAIVQAIGLVLTWLVFDRALAWSDPATRWYWATRLAANNVVWLGFSFPAWHYVFRARSGAQVE